MDDPQTDQPIFYDRTGAPITLDRCVELYADPGYRFLRRETVGSHEVVTAWLGTDQSLGDAPRPLIFGTVALDDDGARFEGQEWLAATEAEAEANHHRLVDRLRTRH